MKNKFPKFIALSVALLMLIPLLSGCSKWRYGAKMYSYPGSNRLVQSEFIDQNRIYKGKYRNPDYYGEGLETDDEKDLNNYEYLPDMTSPESRTFIITDQETFDSIYVENALEVDFDKQMVILHIHLFHGIGTPTYIIHSIEGDEKITIYYKKKKDYSDKKGGTRPNKHCTTVVMKKIDVTSVEFVFVED